jgi:hypothetical protein
MKNTIKSLLALCVACGLFFIAGCDKSSPTPEPTEAEKVTALLKSGAWKIVIVTVDGVPSTSFTGMTMSFTNTGYSTTNGGIVWPSSGSWSFTNATAKVLKRDDGVEVTIDAVAETALSLSLTWGKTTLGKGRTESVSGKHVFVFTK